MLRLAAATALAATLALPATAADIAAAFYVEPTDRYAHGVLGDRIEWAALEAEDPNGVVRAYHIPDASVFEDIAPRLFDIDGDGEREAWVIRADATDGARIEAYGIVGDRLVRRFAGPAIGTGFRWLNPIGVADFDGDGVREAAYIETPHIGGIITVLKPMGDKLEIVARMGGYSTHKIGSKRLDLGAVADLDGDGAAEMILPTQLHDRLAVIGMANGKLYERWRGLSGPRVGGGLALTRDGADWVATYETPAGAPVEQRIPVADLKPVP